MKEIKEFGEMSLFAADCLRRGKMIGFVPTMGALHQGHVSLVERSKADNDLTVVSIFVNPAQFGPGEDLARYPRDMEGDRKKLAGAGADIIFIPSEKDMYQGGYKTYVTVEDLSEKLCGKFRQGHFRGVATVVTKLFHIVRPARAYFGQKDYQQALIIEKLVKDLNMDIQIFACPIVRESDGLAMSSRNAYLSNQERKAAQIIFRALTEISGKIRDRGTVDGIAGEFSKILSIEPLVSEIQYASVYDPLTLEEIKNGNITGEILLAVAVKIGGTRLIDNMLVTI